MNPIGTETLPCVINWQWAPFVELTAAQIYGMLRLRQNVFVLEQRCFYQDADGLDPLCLHCWGLTLRGDLAAYARVVPPGHGFDGPSIGRVVVASEWRTSGLGGLLMSKAIAVTQEQFPGQAVWVSAQAHLETFYAKLGFIPSGDVYDDVGIPHLDMRLAPALFAAADRRPLPPPAATHP